MRFDLQTWQRWSEWICRIRDDLSDLVDDQATFDGFNEMVNANAAWLDQHNGAHFINFVRRGYVTKTVLGIRRHVKCDHESISLQRLFDQLRRAGPQLTYDFYLERFPDDGIPWQQPSFNRLSEDGQTVSPAKIEEDILRLATLNTDIKTMADRDLAHLDMRVYDGTVTFKDLRDAVDIFDQLARRYISFLLGEGYSTLKATVLFDWKAIFRHPWEQRTIDEIRQAQRNRNPTS